MPNRADVNSKTLPEFDGLYETRENPEISLDTANHTAEEIAHVILHYLVARGIIKRRWPAGSRFRVICD